MINIHFLEYIVEFAKTENLTKTSKHLLVSQSALTRAMKNLETYVGVPLFKRSRNKLTLNDTGKEFVKHAEKVIEAQKQMVKATVAYHQRHTNVSIGYTAIGPIIKYGGLLQQIYHNKAISFKEDCEENLLKGLLTHSYDFIFINHEIDTEEICSLYIFTEHLYASFLKDEDMAKNKKELSFSEIDGLTFLISNNIGIWNDIIEEHMPNSKFLVQRFENLSDLIELSVIPNFSTNITIPIYKNSERVDIPITDQAAFVDFYVAFRKKDKKRILKLLKTIQSIA